MIKKIFTLLLVLGWFHFGLYADWKSDISDYFGNKKDYKGAIDYLLGNFEKTDKIHNPIFKGLMAYSFHKLNNKNDEYKWLKEYFETYRGEEIIFSFLDDSTYAEISGYLIAWKRKYPLITETALIDGKIYNSSIPPAKIEIGIDIKNDAYYKLSDRNNIIKGGLLKKGFNIISITADDLFEKSGSHIYYLDLKAGDLFLKKEIEIDIQLDSHEQIKESNDKIKKPEYRLFMFIGDELIISRKKLAYSLPLKIEMPPWPKDYKPFGPADKTNPAFNSFSIFSAVGAIYQLIKGLKTKKSPEKLVSPIKKQKQITTTFIRKNLEGVAKEVKAVIMLKTRDLNGG